MRKRSGTLMTAEQVQGYDRGMSDMLRYNALNLRRARKLQSVVEQHGSLEDQARLTNLITFLSLDTVEKVVQEQAGLTLQQLAPDMFDGLQFSLRDLQFIRKTLNAAVEEDVVYAAGIPRVTAICARIDVYEQRLTNPDTAPSAAVNAQPGDYVTSGPVIAGPTDAIGWPRQGVYFANTEQGQPIIWGESAIYVAESIGAVVTGDLLDSTQQHQQRVRSILAELGHPDNE